MHMELARQALDSLLRKLGALLIDEYKLQKGVRGEIMFLQAEMDGMQAVLTMLSKVPPHQITELDKIWVRDLKELSYDIEDSVDTFMVRIDTPKRPRPRYSFRGFFDTIIGLFTKANIRHHLGNDMEDIRKRILEVANRRARYRVEAASMLPDTMIIDRRVLASFEHAEKLVGTNVPVENVCNLLTRWRHDVHKYRRMVVSIVGVGGLGKTTVANLVYEKLRGQFNCQAFVSVSLKPNMKHILSSILRQVSKDDCKNSREKDPEELVRTIREYLEDKRYIIVIDDVWSEDAWKTIDSALIDKNLGSRVIVTTRSADVVKFSSSIEGSMYELDPLSYEDSKNLLSKRIFDEGYGILSELEEVTMKILKKCGGIPLAIITIASMLASNSHKTKLEWYAAYNYMGTGLEKDKNLENMRQILYLSYSDLPSYLKPCLLYLSMFPEDYDIPRNDLIHLWVAEGFIDDGERRSSLYELGERYFNELMNRSMIQPVRIDVSGTAWACRVHDMILDLIISLSTPENFSAVSSVGRKLISPARKIRRLSLQGNEKDSLEENVILSTMANLSQVRTIIALGGYAFRWMPPLSKFSILRVLVLEYFGHIDENYFNSKELGSLHHLRCLELRGYAFRTEHLDEIGNLKHLKTLDLHDTAIRKLPVSIVQLTQLECLILNHSVKCPNGIGNLVYLQQLEFLDAYKSPHTLAEVGNLTRLRSLSISSLNGVDDNCIETFLRSLSRLHNIHSLNVLERPFAYDKYCSLDYIPDQWSSSACLRRFDGHGRLSKLPRWFKYLSELSCLSIEVNMLGEDDLNLLEALPVLRFLDLSVDHLDPTNERLVIGSYCTAIHTSFCTLTNFKFKHYQRYWLVFAQGVMPKLQRLELYFQAHKRVGDRFDIDFGLENLTSLKHVKVTVDCISAKLWEVEDEEAKYKDMIGKHPNHPTLEIAKENEHLISTK